jgi:hypothetical protein
MNFTRKSANAYVAIITAHHSASDRNGYSTTRHYAIRRANSQGHQRVGKQTSFPAIPLNIARTYFLTGPRPTETSCTDFVHEIWQTKHAASHIICNSSFTCEDNIA